MINGVVIREQDAFTDYRGDLYTTWKDTDLDLGDMFFNHDKVSTSRKHVLRGIHGDEKSWKLVTCLYGEIYFVLVDYRESSDTFIQWDSMILSDRNRKQVLIPPGVGNGFLVLSDHSVFHYKWSYEGEYADVDEQFTIKWNDPMVGIEWPINNPILSRRDK
jgi:dTDP-4-dehydrorhamnose 3,5-epimerase